MIDAPEPESRWKRISTNPLVVLVIGFLLTGLVGALLTNHYNAKQKQLEFELNNLQRDREREKDNRQRDLEQEKDRRQKDLEFERNKQERQREVEHDDRQKDLEYQRSLQQTQIEREKDRRQKDIESQRTSMYNDAQLQVQKAQQAASRASAEANASLAYLQFLAREPAPSQDQRDQALMAVGGVLPPELSFNLAVKRLPQEPSVLNLLLSVYGDQSWKYLSPFIEEASTADPILQLLHQQNLLEREFDWLASNANDRPHRRLAAFASYFEFLRKLDSAQHPEIHKPATRALVNRMLSQPDVDEGIKSDLAAAAALVFVTEPGYEPDWDFLTAAAKTFWDRFDTNVGALPAEGSQTYQLYFKRFHVQHADKQVPLPATDVASGALVPPLLAGRLEQRGIHELGRLLYSYCSYVPRDGADPFSPYLNPRDGLRLLRGVIAAANTPARKQQLSQELGSLTGDILYRNIGRDKDVRREFAEVLLKWYEQNAAHQWGIPKFLSNVANDYPELEPRIQAVFKLVR